MRKYNKRHDQKMLDEEKRIREETILVLPPRLEPKVREAMMRPVRKDKGTNARRKNGKPPVM